MTGPRQKAGVKLAQDIVAYMYENDMKKGDRYLSEGDALKRHGVARATLREALRFLEILGVVEVRAGPGGGAIVDKPDWPHLTSTFALILQFAHAPLRAVLEARRVIEPGMVELAALNATEAEVAGMAAALDAIEANLVVYRDFSEAYARYWRLLADSAHNAVLSFLCPALRAIVDSGGFVPNELYRGELLKRLRAIHAAIAARDTALARHHMAELEDEFLERLTTRYPRQMERVVSWEEVLKVR